MYADGGCCSSCLYQEIMFFVFASYVLGGSSSEAEFDGDGRIEDTDNRIWQF